MICGLSLCAAKTKISSATQLSELKLVMHSPKLLVESILAFQQSRQPTFSFFSFPSDKTFIPFGFMHDSLDPRYLENRY